MPQTGKNPFPAIAARRVREISNPSIFVVGLLHVISNATQDLAKTLVYWPEFLPRLKQICRLLGRPWLKNRLKEQCCSRGDLRILGGSGAF